MLVLTVACVRSCVISHYIVVHLMEKIQFSLNSHLFAYPIIFKEL